MLLTSPAEVHSWRRALPGHSTVGFVPTMGALHAGHQTLIAKSAKENDHTVVSIFVNPTQFNVTADYDKYPRTLDTDIAAALQSGAEVIFAPTAKDMYPEGFSSFVEPGSNAATLEGQRRPGHFRGVTTIVNKLFNIVQPTRAYFGKKDFQQLAVIRQMVTELNIDVEVIGVDTVRDTDGVALSSRNSLLSPENRQRAVVIPRALNHARDLVAAGERSVSTIVEAVTSIIRQESAAIVEYVELRDAQTLNEIADVTSRAVLFVAAYFGEVRLIDNLELEPGTFTS